jgi:hypothetical protein
MSTSRAGPKRATWRHSSLPMLPPAPVMSTCAPTVRPMPASSSCTGSRPSRSSGSMSRTRSIAARALCSSSGCRHGQHRQSAGRGQLEGAPPLRAAGGRHGDDDVGGRATHGAVAHRLQRPEHRHAADARALLGRVVVEQPQHDPALAVDAASSRAASPAPSTMATRFDLGVAAGDARARLLVDHAVGHAHQAQPHQRQQRVQRQHRARHPASCSHQHGHRADRAGQQRRPAPCA